MRGRKPKPRALRVVGGNAGKRPIPPEMVPTGTFDTKPPAGLDSGARKEWRRVVGGAPEGLLTCLDRGILIAYCQAFSRAVQADKVISKCGLTLATPQGFEQARPEVSISRQSWDAVRKFAVELGFSPSARTRVHVATPAAGDDNPFAEFVA